MQHICWSTQEILKGLCQSSRMEHQLNDRLAGCILVGLTDAP